MTKGSRRTKHAAHHTAKKTPVKKHAATKTAAKKVRAGKAGKVHRRF